LVGAYISKMNGLFSSFFLWVTNLNVPLVIQLIIMFGVPAILIAALIYFLGSIILAIIQKASNSKKKSVFIEKQKNAINEISELINIATDNSLSFLQGISLQGEPSLKDQCINTRNSGKELMDYFNDEKNRLYFSESTSEIIVELYQLISVCTHHMYEAIRDSFYVSLWNQEADKLRKVEDLRNKIFSDFHEILKEIE
jgi:hypothetical protein